MKNRIIEKMKNKLVIAIFCAPIYFVSIANAKDFDVVANSIDFTVAAGSSVSRSGEESSEEIVKNGSISVSVTEHVVVRSGTSKSSFSPLKNQADQNGVSTAIRKLIGVNVPESYASVMTLYQSFYMEDGATKRDCKVLVLDNLLETSHQTNLRDFLQSNEVTIEERNEFFTFECSVGK